MFTGSVSLRLIIKDLSHTTFWFTLFFPDRRLIQTHQQGSTDPGLSRALGGHGGGGGWGTCSCSAAQPCPALCSPADCSPPGSSVHGIVQARKLEWVAISSSRASSGPRDLTCISCVSCTGRRILHGWCHLGSPVA